MGARPIIVGYENQLVEFLNENADYSDLITDDPIQLKRSPLTVFVVVVYTYVLFMVFPMFNVMATLDRNQIEAARDLGAAPWRVFRRLTLPYLFPALASTAVIAFMASMERCCCAIAVKASSRSIPRGSNRPQPRTRSRSNTCARKDTTFRHSGRNLSASSRARRHLAWISFSLSATRRQTRNARLGRDSRSTAIGGCPIL